MSKEDNKTQVYRKLQEHLDKMPMGYPSTKTGVEISLLKRIFTEEQALVATHLHYKHKTIDQIFETAKNEVGSREELKRILNETVTNGGIFRRRRDGKSQYALMPFLLWGMYEHQLKRLSKEFMDDCGKYMGGEFGLEMATSTLSKMRVVPIEESVKAELNVASYDELRQIIKQAGNHIAIQECFCRKVGDMNNKPCKATIRREVCMSLGDLAELYVEEGWARRVSQEEALEIARKNEDEGLVMMPGNAQEPNFFCSCCNDCCGMLSLMKGFPKPAEVVASNYYAKIDPKLCKNCGTCVSRCPIDAVVKKDSTNIVDLKRCIGCGLCVPTCEEKAMQLIAKEKEVIPPKTEEEHYDTIYANRMSLKGKIRGFAIKTVIRTMTSLSKLKNKK